MAVPFHVPAIGQEEIAAVSKVLDSGWLTTGRVTAEFENALAAKVGAAHGVAVNSATAALHLALAALGLGPGDEVIVPVHTFAATAEVVVYTGATPVLVDINPDTLNIDPIAVKEAITSQTAAIMPVHFTGQAADLEPLLATADGIPVIEDAAHAFPTRYRDMTVGSIGTATAFSFYANKTITTGEGGMLTTDDTELADRARLLSLHGLSSAAWNRFGTGAKWEYDIVDVGYKYNLTDIAAAIGLVQLAKADELAARRRWIAARYDQAFASIAAIDPVLVEAPEDSSWHLYIIRLRHEELGVDRNGFIDALASAGIGTSVHYKPLHLHPYYIRRFGYKPTDFPVSTDQFSRIISLPIYPDMEVGEVDEVVDNVQRIVDDHSL